MAITSTQVSLASAATLIVQADSDGCAVTVHIPGNSSAYIGASDVSTSNGLFLDKGSGPRMFTLAATDALYGVSSSGTVVITALRIG
jgi:hypothetical protein